MALEHRLEGDERVIVTVRSHPIRVVVALVVSIAVGVAGVLGLRAIHETSRPFLDALLVLIALLACWTAVRAVRWSVRSVTVTDRRVGVSKGLVRRRHHEVRLRSIRGVRVRTGVLGRFIGRGDVELEIDGDEPFVLEDMRRPQTLRRVIERLLGEPVPERESGGDVLGRLDMLDRLFAEGRVEAQEYERERARILGDL